MRTSTVALPIETDTAEVLEKRRCVFPSPETVARRSNPNFTTFAHTRLMSQESLSGARSLAKARIESRFDEQETFCSSIAGTSESSRDS